MVLPIQFYDPKIVIRGIEWLFLQKILPGTREILQEFVLQVAKSSFFAVASACNWVAVIAFAFIQSSSGSLVIEAINMGSSSLFWSGSVGFPSIIAFFPNIFSILGETGFCHWRRTFFLRSCTRQPPPFSSWCQGSVGWARGTLG